jgi:hypothetical protein
MGEGLTLLRKLVILGSTAALVAGSLFIAGASGAGATKIDVANDSITCNAVSATASIKPGLTGAGPNNVPTQLTVKGTVASCQVDGPGGASVLSGTFSGKLANVGGNCTALIGTTPTTGTLVFKWKADPTTPLVETSSTVNVSGITGGLHNESLDHGGQTYGDFIVNSSSVAGAFTGGDSGGSSHNESVATEDLNGILNTCATAKGLTKVHIGLGTFTLG